MTGTVSTASIVFMAVSCAFSFAVPVVLIEVAVAVITAVYVLIAKKVWDRETASENTADGAAFVQ